MKTKMNLVIHQEKQMTREEALDIVIAAAREHAQLRSDWPDASEEEQHQTELMWEAIEMIEKASYCRSA